MAKTMTKVTKIEGGSVSIGMGIKFSSNYNSTDFNMQITLPIQPGETPADAATRVHDLAAGVFNEKAQPALNLLSTHITQRKTPGR